MKQLEKPILPSAAVVETSPCCDTQHPLSTPTVHPSPLTGEWAEYAWCSSREASEILMKAESLIFMASEAGEDDDHTQAPPSETDEAEEATTDDMAHSDEHKSVTQDDLLEEKVAAPLSVDHHDDVEYAVAPNLLPAMHDPYYNHYASNPLPPHSSPYNSYEMPATEVYPSMYPQHSTGSTITYCSTHDPYSMERNFSSDIGSNYYHAASTDYHGCTNGMVGAEYPCYCSNCYPTPLPAHAGYEIPQYHHHSPAQPPAPLPVKMPAYSSSPRYVSSYPRVDSAHSYASAAAPMYYEHSGTLSSFEGTVSGYSDLSSSNNGGGMGAPLSSADYSPDAGTPAFIHHYRDTDKNASRRRKSTRFPVPPPPTKTRQFLTEERFYHAVMRWYSHIHDWDISKAPCPPPLNPSETEAPVEYSYEDWLLMIDEWYNSHFSNTRRPVRHHRH